MKKITSIILSVLLIITLTGCGNEAPSSEPGAEEFRLTIKNECTAEIFGFHFEYSIGDASAGGGKVVYASGDPVERGDSMTKDFIPQDFPKDSDLSQLFVNVSVLVKDGGEIPLDTLSINANYGETYKYRLEGNLTEGFSLVSED